VNDLKRLGHNEQARDLLLELCEAAEEEGTATGLAVPPWYFEQTAIVCRKLKDYDAEVAILERYLANPRAVRGNLDARLEKARAKVGKPHPPPPSVEPVAGGHSGLVRGPLGRCNGPALPRRVTVDRSPRPEAPVAGTSRLAGPRRDCCQIDRAPSERRAQPVPPTAGPGRSVEQPAPGPSTRCELVTTGELTGRQQALRDGRRRAMKPVASAPTAR
jgi:hypothetical protein